MAEGGGLGKSKNLLSVSLPDVSASNHHPSSFRPSQLPPLPDIPFLSPAKTPNIDDDAWADKADPVTGSVFYIEPTTSVSSRCSLVPSSSSSSLSSSPPMSEFLVPHSPTYSAAHYSLPDRFSGSVQLPLPDSPRSLEEFTSSLSPAVSSGSGSFHHADKPRSLRKKLQKIITAKKTRSLQSDSMSDLDSESISSPQADMFLQIPQASQYGSHGTPLSSSPLIGFQTKVELDLCPFQLGAEGVACSLERLGIVPARSLGKWKFGSLVSLRLASFKTHYPPPSPSAAQPVVVRAVVPGYPAATTQLKPGDTIVSVNQHAVNLDNIDSVLATLSNKLQLLIKKGRSRSRTHASSATLLSPPPPPSPHMSSSGGLVRLVMGGRGSASSLGRRKQQGHFYMLLYITLDTKEDDPPEKDILFQYPKLGDDGGVAKTLQQLVRLRGALLTLSDTLVTITGSPAPSNSSVLLDGRMVHFSCMQKGKELLLLALPAELATQYQLQLLVETVEETISLMFGSIHDAFTSFSSRSSVEHVLSLMFDAMFSELPLTPSSSLLGVPSFPRLKLPTDVTMKLDALLSGLESCDHSNRPEMLSLSRPFLLTGSCLVHKGALACSHLPPADQRGVALFCHAYRLLELTASESVSQIVIWKEVFLPPAEGVWQGCGSQVRRKMFLLAVGLEQTLLCMLMRQGSLVDSDLFLGVDAVYVDRGRGLLLDLRAQDLLNQDTGDSAPLPALVSADVALHSVFRRSSRPLVVSASHLGNLVAAAGGNRKLPSFVATGRNSFDGGSDSDDEAPPIGGTRRTQSMLHLKPHFRQRKAQRGVARGASLDSGEGGSRKSTMATPRQPYTLTAGQDNLLLHYIHLEVGRGLMLCPTQTTPSGCVQSELLKSFHQTCYVVRQVLRGGRREGEESAESPSESESDEWDSEGEGEEQEVKVPRPFIPKASSVVEHGVLWECRTRSLKTTATMRYWVIGRYYKESEQELYICCQENISQSTVEMAFKMLYGWTG